MSTPESPAGPVDQTPNKSCELCKVRKVRCDRKLPSCSWCVRHGRHCVYTERKRPGVPPNRSIQMEEKMEALESNLQTLANRLDSYASDLGDPASPLSTDRGSRRGGIPRSYSHNDAQRSRPSFSPTSSSADAALTLGAIFDTPSFPGLDDDFCGQYQLPPVAVLREVIKSFLKDLSSWAPLLSQRTLEGLLESDLMDADNAILLHGILVVSIRNCPNSNLHATESSLYYHRAKKRILEHVTGHTNIRSTQALVLLTLEALSSKDDSEGRKLLCMLHQSLLHLSLVREPLVFFTTPWQKSGHESRFTPPRILQPNDWLDREERRRLAWTVYMLDRYATVGTTKSFIIPELTIPFPRHHSNDDQTLNTGLQWYGQLVSDAELKDYEKGTFSRHCELLVILSQMHDFCTAPLDPDSGIAVHTWTRKFRVIDAMLHGWMANLPQSLTLFQEADESQVSPDPSWVNLQASRFFAIVRLNSLAAYPFQETQQFRYSTNARQRCLEAVDTMRALSLEFSSKQSLQVLGPNFAFVNFICASLLLVHASATAIDIDRTVWFFVSVLDRIGHRWLIAKQYAESLRSILHHVDRNTVRTSPNGSDAATQNLTILRRRAHEIILMSSKTRDSVYDIASNHSLAEHDLAAVTVFGFFQSPVFVIPSNRYGNGTLTPSLPNAVEIMSPWELRSPIEDPFAIDMTHMDITVPQQYDWVDSLPQ